MIVDYDGYLMMMMISSKTINDYTIGVYIYIWESMTDYHTKIVQPYGEIHKWGYPNSWMVYFMEDPIKIDNLIVPLF